MKHLFIVNPAAGGEDKTGYVTEKAAAVLSGRDEAWEIYVTKAPMDGCEKIRAEAASGETLRVYACGGDGTLNECVNGAAGLSNVAVTHFPCGTGNDTIKMFGDDKERFFDLRQLVEGEAYPMDVICCNERCSMNICSVGIDARIGCNVHKYSALPLIGGAVAYVVSTVVELVRGVKRHMKVTTGGKVYDMPMTLVCACNGQFYGGGFHPVPSARPDDGLLDFLVIRGVSRLTFLRLVGAYAQGKGEKYPQYITHLRGTEMTIECAEELTVNVDGEELHAKTVHFEIVPGGVNFILPANMACFVPAREKIGVK